MEYTLTISGAGAGEGLAAVSGHQSGVEGAAVAMPVLSREIKTVDRLLIPLPGDNSVFVMKTK